MRARQSCYESGLLNVARVNAERSLRSLLESLGHEQVRFQWQGA